MNIGKFYYIENCKIKIFDDFKFVNNVEFIKIIKISDILNVNLIIL